MSTVTAARRSYGARNHRTAACASPTLVPGLGIDLSLAFVGLLLNVFAYQSLFPAAAAGLIFGLAGTVITMSYGGGSWEFRMFRRLFATGWIACGIAGVFAEHFHDPFQLDSDAAGFFELASGGSAGVTLEELRRVSEGALAVYAWRAVYDAFASIGFPRERYIGVLVNVLFVALTGVIAVRIARQIYGADAVRIRRLVLMMSCSGMLWLFAGLHLRDSAVLLAVTGLVAVWVWFLRQPRLGVRMALVACASIVLSTPLAMLRGEFVFVPFALGLAALAAAVLSQGLSPRRLAALGAGALLVAVVFFAIKDGLGAMFERGGTGYGELAELQSARDSLGMRLVVNQPMPVRALIGAIYLYVFPIPMWSGFGSNSAYHWYKSMNVVAMYCILPLVAIAVGLLRKGEASIRRTQVLFLLCVALGMSVAIALTSLETRHSAVFLVTVFVAALLPNLNDSRVWRRYVKLLCITLVGVTLVHVAWLALRIG